MKNGLIKCLLVILCISLAGCTNSKNENIGIATGAVAGGLIGSTVGGGAAIAGGAVIGGLLGGLIGKSMDDSDKTKMNQAMNNPPGKPSHWVNKSTGATYTVVPTSRVNVNGNPNCRKYYTTATINGKRQRLYGVACPTGNGNWQIVS